MSAIFAPNGAPQTSVRNDSSAIYVIDGSGPDYRILHAHSGPTSYVLPVPTEGRTLEIQDTTGGIETAPNTVFLVPFGQQSINGFGGFGLTGSGDSNGFFLTNGSPIVTAPNGLFTTELAVGMSIRSDFQWTAHYIVASIESDTSLTLTANYTGETTGGQSHCARTSVAFASNMGRLAIESFGGQWYISLIHAL